MLANFLAIVVKSADNKNAVAENQLVLSINQAKLPQFQNFLCNKTATKGKYKLLLETELLIQKVKKIKKKKV